MTDWLEVGDEVLFRQRFIEGPRTGKVWTIAAGGHTLQRIPWAGLWGRRDVRIQIEGGPSLELFDEWDCTNDVLLGKPEDDDDHPMGRTS